MKGIELAKTAIEAVPNTAHAIATIEQIKRTTGISARQKKRLIMEAKTDAEIADIFAEMCQAHPGLAFEEQIGNLKLSNVNQVLSMAQQEFSQEDDAIPTADLDQEWLLKFLDVAGETSELEKQTILAKVFAGQLKKPDSISYRTLRILKDLSHKDLVLFNKAVSVSFHNSNAYMLLPRESAYISVGEVMLLDECGLMDSSDSKNLQLRETEKLISCRNQYLLVLELATNERVSVDCYYFTDSALELLPMMNVNEADESAIKGIARCFRGNNRHVGLHRFKEEKDKLFYFYTENLLG